MRGWYAAAGKIAVILMHGYGGNRRDMLERAALLYRAGYGVLLYDARACGESLGERISFGYYETADLLAAVDFLKGRAVENIICLGVSQGGATIALAADRLQGLGIRAVILESVYDDMRGAVDRRFRHYLKMPWWVGGALLVPIAEMRLGVDIDDIAPVRSITRIRCPLLVIGGAADTRVPAADTRQLFRAARQPKRLWLVPGADHEDLYQTAGSRYATVLLDFLNDEVEGAVSAPMHGGPPGE